MITWKCFLGDEGRVAYPNGPWPWHKILRGKKGKHEARSGTKVEKRIVECRPGKDLGRKNCGPEGVTKQRP